MKIAHKMSRPIKGEDEDEFYASMAAATPVSLLMTKSADLMTCEATDDATEVVERPDLSDFDHIPVKSEGQIIGIFDRATPGITGSVDKTFRRLSARYLIGDRTSVFSFIERADSERCCIVIGEKGVVGMVTVSDLQKLPVQVALFGLTAQFESLVSDHLRRALDDAQEKYASVLGLLAPNEVRKVRGFQRHNEARNLSIDWISPLSLGQKLKALRAVRPQIMNWTEAEQVRDLRDSIAHGKEFARTYDLIKNLVSSKRAMVSLISRLKRTLR
ncbi:CBS domain-containing protein [Mesorhizobium jarvisii]